MPTDEWFKENPKVSAYIPQNLNEKLTDWMKGRSIKKVSQALTTILEEYLRVVQNKPIAEDSEGDRLKTLEQKFESLFQVVQRLEEAIQASSLQVVQIKPKQESLPLLDAIAAIETKQSIEVVEEIQDDEPDEILYEFLETEEQKLNDEEKVEQIEPTEHEIWTTHQVNEVLGVSRGTLERWNKKGSLPQTTEGHTILKWAGKQAERPFSNLWEVRKSPII